MSANSSSSPASPSTPSTGSRPVQQAKLRSSPASPTKIESRRSKLTATLVAEQALKRPEITLAVVRICEEPADSCVTVVRRVTRKQALVFKNLVNRYADEMDTQPAGWLVELFNPEREYYMWKLFTEEQWNESVLDADDLSYICDMIGTEDDVDEFFANKPTIFQEMSVFDYNEANFGETITLVTFGFC
jgi:hypothetical protein